MSAVVVEELYAGARGREIRMIELLERSFTAAERMLVPDLNDWKQAGLLLARIAERYGYDQIGRGRLTNDALLAVSSLRPKATVVTMNQRDFARLAEFGQFNWEPVPSNPKP